MSRRTVTIPAGVTVDPTKPPVWVKIGSGTTSLWHDPVPSVATVSSTPGGHATA